mmetsp:Transcript_103098/g.266581  ORF Transcript_103098/g.266581 Transcript_103098/m.266581 type:complete len:286 (+) Transcript_103098:169-1026(+)
MGSNLPQGPGRGLVEGNEEVHQVPVQVRSLRHGLHQHAVLQAQVGNPHDDLEQAVAALHHLLVPPCSVLHTCRGSGHARDDVQASPQHGVASADRQEIRGLEGPQLHVVLVLELHEVDGHHHRLAAHEGLPELPGCACHAMQHLDERDVGRRSRFQRRKATNEHQHAAIGFHLLWLQTGVEQVGAQHDEFLQRRVWVLNGLEVLRHLAENPLRNVPLLGKARQGGEREPAQRRRHSIARDELDQRGEDLRLRKQLLVIRAGGSKVVEREQRQVEALEVLFSVAVG